MLEIGEKVELDNNKEYIVTNKTNLHNINYLYLVSNFKPLEMLVVSEKDENGEIVLNEVKDNNELDYVLSHLATADDLTNN